MTTRCIRCGTLIQGMSQMCDDCAAQQAKATGFPQATSPQSAPEVAPPAPPAPATGSCPSCSSALTPGSAFCGVCGAAASKAGSPGFCAACGAALTPGVQFCANCGAQVAAGRLNIDVTGQRILAGLIDLAILLFVLVGFFLVFGESNDNGQVRNNEADFYLPTGPFLLFLVVAYGYYVVLEGLTQSTLGKMLFGLRVVRLDGQPYGIGFVLLRNILRLIDGIFFYLVGVITIAVTKKNQRLGDLAAGTVVVKD